MKPKDLLIRSFNIQPQIRIFTLLFLFLIGNGLDITFSSAVAQTKKKKKTAVQQKKKKSPTTVTPAKTTQFFEGALLYRNEEYHSGMEKRFSYGRAYNGERTVSVIVKGQTVHITDETLHLHTIVNPVDDISYMFSDLTKKGIKGTIKQLEPYIGMLSPDYIIPKSESESEPEPITSTLAMSNEKASYDGQKYGVYKGEIMRGDNNRLSVEMWIWDKYKITKSFDYTFLGLPVPGIVRKGIYSQIISVPLLGKMKNMIALELVAYSTQKVKPSEMLPPSDCQIEDFKDYKSVVNLYKDNRSQLKKLKLLPKSKSKKETVRNIEEKWDFADDWLKKEVSTENNTRAWKTLGDYALRAANAFSGNQISAPNTDSHSQMYETSSETPSMPDIDRDRSEESIEEPSAEKLAKDAELARKYNEVKSKYDRVAGEQRSATARTMSLVRSHGANPHTNLIVKAMEKECELIKKRKEVALELKQVIVEINTGEKMTDKQLSVERKRIDRDIKKFEKEIKTSKVSYFVSGEGSRYVKYYQTNKEEVYDIKHGHRKYNHYTVSERIRMVKECQSKMKEYRAKYKEGAGKDLPGADSSLENWNPRDKDLLDLDD